MPPEDMPPPAEDDFLLDFFEDFFEVLREAFLADFLLPLLLFLLAFLADFFFATIHSSCRAPPVGVSTRAG